MTAVSIAATSYYLSKNLAIVKKTDLVVVFPGDSERIKQGHILVESGISDNYMVIGRHPSVQKTKSESIASGRHFATFPGGKSRSTFEDVYQTIQTIQEHNFRSVVLVTSNYHMPRALCLLLLYSKIVNINIFIQPYTVSISEPDFKHLNNETVKFWGSITELVIHWLSGDLALNNPRLRKAQITLKSYLTWQIN